MTAITRAGSDVLVRHSVSRPNLLFDVVRHHLERIAVGNGRANDQGAQLIAQLIIRFQAHEYDHHLQTQIYRQPAQTPPESAEASVTHQ